MMVLTTLFVATSVLATPNPYVFGAGEQWYSFDLKTRANKPLALPEGVHATSVALEPKTGCVAYTSKTRGAVFDVLFLWCPGANASPRRIGLGQGRHADPVFSADGESLYFVANTRMPAQSGGHAPMDYAQLYRHSIATGVTVRLTKTDGCKARPVPIAATGLLVVHNDCRGQQRIVRVAPDVDSPATEVKPPAFQRAEESAPSADGATLLLTLKGQNTWTIAEYSIKKRTLTQKFSLDNSGTPPRVAYGLRRGEIIYQTNAGLFAFDGRRHSLIAKIGDISP